MNKRSRFDWETMVLILIIVVLFLLIVRVRSQGEDYDCSKCVVEFKSKVGFMENYTSMLNISGEELVQEFKQGECPVVWDKTQGYMRG